MIRCVYPQTGAGMTAYAEFPSPGAGPRVPCFCGGDKKFAAARFLSLDRRIASPGAMLLRR
jgi:hypothetical protein